MSKLMTLVGTALALAAVGCDGFWNVTHIVAAHVADAIQTWGALDQLGYVGV